MATVAAITTPSNPDKLHAETRSGELRTVFDLVKTDGQITGIVYISDLQGITRDWVLEQRFSIDVAE